MDFLLDSCDVATEGGVFDRAHCPCWSHGTSLQDIALATVSAWLRCSRIHRSPSTLNPKSRYDPASYDPASYLIAAASEYGIEIAAAFGGESEEPLPISGNRIGTDRSGMRDLGNAMGGIRVYYDARHIRIGGASAEEGNIISGNDGPGVLIESVSSLHPSNIVVRGNLIGLDASGTNALPNAGHGIEIRDAAHYISVGNGEVDGRNVIAGNAGDGIHITDAHHCSVAGNYIGSDNTGTATVANAQSGIVIDDAWHNTIGGSQPADRILVSGNGEHGIEITGAASVSNTIVNTAIGTTSDGEDPMGNTVDGIYIGGASMTRIGDDGAFEAVTIAHNGGNGVTLVSGVSNTVTATEIHANGGLGIDLGNDGVTVNDADDTDAGPNGLQNFPVIENVMSGSATVDGSLDSAPNRTYRLDFFMDAAADPSGYGEGAAYLGSTNVTTDGSGDAAFSVHFAVNLPVGYFITATATDITTGDTSEFSPAFEYVAADDDGDGIPNAWEQHYFDGPTNAVPDGNPDHDPFTTFEEYIGDTDPDDGASYLRIDAITAGDGPAVWLWSSSSRLYQLQYRDDLTDSNGWHDLPPWFYGADGQMGLTDGTGRTNRYYRVNVRLPSP